MYRIEQIDYHYYYQLEEGINDLMKQGREVVQILILSKPSGDNEKMHRATVLTREINKESLDGRD